MTKAEALRELQAILGQSAFVEHSYFSPAHRNMWFVGFRNELGNPVIRGQAPFLADAIAEVKQFYQSGTPAQQKGRER